MKELISSMDNELLPEEKIKMVKIWVKNGLKEELKEVPLHIASAMDILGQGYLKYRRPDRKELKKLEQEKERNRSIKKTQIKECCERF